ncbi:hypothetical protein JKF63_06279 [Porcisia hertigi]|uniref:Uncharacterized protein n=1 Tax=Porcisia hertigi TaxID=2761500 RepID=A0A836IHE7_9TRYP|nr:hypothetical protein JKF63_06279 [Porcisia hertigi]
MSLYEEEEPFDLTSRSGGAGHSGISSLDTIIHALNKRYEVYQRRHASVTPLSSPADPSTFAPPVLHSILGDSTTVSGTSASPGGSGTGGAGAAATQQPLKPPESPIEPIVAPRARPTPYWEERELYIAAEDLCRCLNGGINYRLLCERYRRALEVLLALVSEDVQLCKSSDMELVPGGMTRLFLGKLKELLKESKRLLEGASVNVPARLATIIERLPGGDSLDALGSSASGLTTSAATGSAANHDESVSNEYTRSHRQIPLHMRPPPVPPVEGRNAAAAERETLLPAPQNDPHPGYPENGYPQHRSAGSGNGIRSSQHPVMFLSSERCSTSVISGNKSSLANVVENPHQGPGGALHSGSGLNAAVPSGQAAASTATGKVCDAASTQGSFQRQGPPRSETAPAKHCASNQSTSPTPATPMSATNASNTHGHAYKVESGSVIGGGSSSSDVQMSTDAREEDALGEDKEDITLTARTSGRGRLRRLEELYEEFYARDGVEFLTDALSVVFTREYDQDTAQTCQNALIALQRDVKDKVMPALESYKSLQLRITDGAPLRSVYLTSCLAHRVRPNNTVLDHIKRIDDYRSVETMLFGGLHLGDRGVAALVESVVPRTYRLRQLDLSDNDVTDGALEPLLRSLKHHPSLVHLNLSRNPLTESATPLLLRIARSVPRLSELLLHNCAMKSATQQIVEAEVKIPRTCATPTVSRRCSLRTRFCTSSTTLSPSRSVASPAPPLGPGRQSSPRPTVRAESLPIGSSKQIKGDRNAPKAAFPRGLGVVLDPIRPKPAVLSPSSHPARLPPGSMARTAVKK